MVGAMVAGVTDDIAMDASIVTVTEPTLRLGEMSFIQPKKR